MAQTPKTQIEVSLFAMLRKYIDGAASVDVSIEPGRTIADVLEQLGVPADQTRILFLDNRAAKLTDPLQGGEHLAVFPGIAGG